MCPTCDPHANLKNFSFQKIIQNDKQSSFITGFQTRQDCMFIHMHDYLLLGQAGDMSLGQTGEHV